MGLHFTKNWQREGYKYWAAYLIESGNLISLKTLFDEANAEYESPLIQDCFSGIAVDFFIEKWGKTSFLENYKEWVPNKKALENLESDWQKYCSKLSKNYPQKQKKEAQHAYLKGFNFAHEGYRIFNGYMSNLATESIEKQANLGSNAIAIVPYTYMSDDTKPSPLPIPSHPSQENDQGVIHSAFEAKRIGMKAMLKPQIYFRGSWPGALEMKSEEDWQLFFDHYYRYIRHYAFLAEIHEIDMLCVGVEFSKATLSHEKEWRKIFRKIRDLYHGQLTYAANWGDEFEKVNFWDELDFIGLNSYYPLSKNDNPTNDELSQNFIAVERKIEKVYQKFKKPIVFTEIGFRSIDAPWKNPHAESDNPTNQDHQARCYQVIFEGIKDKTWCGGILWWKFPSYLEYRGTENTAFTPNRKKAEFIIKDWFKNKI